MSHQGEEVLRTKLILCLNDRVLFTDLKVKDPVAILLKPSDLAWNVRIPVLGYELVILLPIELPLNLAVAPDPQRIISVKSQGESL